MSMLDALANWAALDYRGDLVPPHKVLTIPVVGPEPYNTLVHVRASAAFGLDYVNVGLGLPLRTLVRPRRYDATIAFQGIFPAR